MNKRKMNNKLNDEEIKYINLLFETMHEKLQDFIGYIFEFKNQDNISVSFNLIFRNLNIF